MKLKEIVILLGISSIDIFTQFLFNLYSMFDHFARTLSKRNAHRYSELSTITKLIIIVEIRITLDAYYRIESKNIIVVLPSCDVLVYDYLRTIS